MNGGLADPVVAAAGYDRKQPNSGWRDALEVTVKRLEAAKAEGKTSVYLTNSQSTSAKSSGAQGHKVSVTHIDWFKQVIAVPVPVPKVAAKTVAEPVVTV